MNVGPNLLHLVLLVCAVSCAALTLREVRPRPMRQGRLAAPVLLSGICAFVFLMFEVGMGHSPWTCLVALAVGLVGGGLFGFTLKLQVDHLFAAVRLPRSRDSFLIALVLLGTVLIDIGGAFAGTAGAPIRSVTGDVAAGCAGLLIGRWIAIQVRWRSEPHIDLYQI